MTQNLLGSETLTYAYNAMGALSSLSGVSTYVSQVHYDASGQMTDQLLGNGLMQQSCYDANTERLVSTRTYSGSLQSCVVTMPANARLNLGYSYQNNGNISQMVDHTRGDETLNYTYDELDRLFSVSGAYSKSYTYNEIGNIVTGSGSTYYYNDTNHKHAVTSLSTGESYTYDANGNMITRVENGQTYTQTFDIENRLASVTVGGQTTQFFYDGDGNLFKKLKPDGSKTFYHGMYEVDKSSGGTVTKIAVYYPVGGAMRINGPLYFILGDHLGSASVVTDASGTAVGEDRFYPYGETRFTTGTMNTDKLFTGQREETGLGIYHYGARFYSPKLGRFLSADTVVQSMTEPQTLNRFSYGLNNPSRYTDPTGHMAVSDTNEAGCSGSGPSCIIDMYSGYGDYEGMDDSLQDYVEENPDYNPAADPELSQEEQFIVANAMFQVAVRSGSSEEIVSTGGLLSLLALIVSGFDINLSPDEGGGGSGLFDDDISRTLRQIDEGGPFPFRQDGQIFQNREGFLPEKPSGYYHEYTVVSPGASNRGTVRIVTGQNGEAYITYDHYKSFTRIR